MDIFPTLPLEATPLIAFGLLLIFGAIGGYIAHRLTWLPSITGFMAIGFLIGPSGLGFLSQPTLSSARIVVDIALALILYRLGLSLDLRVIWRDRKLALISVVESGITFGVVLYVLHLFGLPLVVAALVAAIAISSSPAVLLHVAHEVGAEGTVTETAKTLVALNNCISFVAYSAVLPLMHHSIGSGWVQIIVQPSYRLLGSLALGVIFGIVVHQLATRTKDADQYILAIVIGSTMLSIGLASELSLSTILVPLIIGITLSTLEREKLLSQIEFGSAFELFFIVLFVYAGASLHLHELVEYWPVVLALVGARSLAKLLSVTASSPLAGLTIRSGVSSGMLLIPMAGLAIGLVQTTSHLFPQHSDTVAAIVLGAVALFETLGPPIAKAAFRLCGESAVGGKHRRP